MSEKPIRLLVVEDNPEDFEILRIYLSKIKHRRYELNNAASLSAGLEELRKKEHDAYLVDYKLGPDTGLDFLREAIQVEKCQAPIILLTGFGDYELDMEAMSLGAADFLNKNKLDSDMLERSVRYAIDRKRSEAALKKHEEEMRLVQKMDAIGRLAGGVAHDFNNLLSVVGGNVEFMLENSKEGDAHRDEMLEVQKAVRQGAELTKQLLVFGQKQVSQPRAVDLNEVAREMNKMFKRVIDANIDLTIIPDGGLKPILADPGQMQQVILNLVLNARDAMPKGGTLILETKNIRVNGSEEGMKDPLPPGDYVQLNVTDTGTGMTAEIQKQIFEPFFTTKEGKGTGLGLASVYGIVKKWNGFIAVHSVLGVGSTFSLSFPALAAMEKVEAKPKQETLIPMGSETILVAEDEEPVRKILVRALEKHGYQVLQASNGVEALEKAEKHYGKIDLLVTDTVMPKMNGKELADALKRSRAKVKVIFISGYTQEILSQQGILESRIHLIQKPFELDGLVREVRKMLDEK